MSSSCNLSNGESILLRTDFTFLTRVCKHIGRQLKIVHIRKSSWLFFDHPLPKMQQTVCCIFDPLLTIFVPSQLFIWFVDQFIPAYLVARSTLSSAPVTSDLTMSKIPVTYAFSFLFCRKYLSLQVNFCKKQGRKISILRSASASISHLKN